MPVKSLFQQILPHPLETKNGTFYLELLDSRHIEGVAKLYKGAYERNEYWLCPTCPSENIFDHDWLREKINNPQFSWMVLTYNSEIAGAKVFIEHPDRTTSDELMFSPNYRGLGLLPKMYDHLFTELHRNVPSIVDGRIMLWPSAKPVRKALQERQNWKPLGILPGRVHMRNGKPYHLLPVAYYPSTLTVRARMIQPVADFYRLVGIQLDLPEPEIVEPYKPLEPLKTNPTQYEYAIVGTDDPDSQVEAYNNGFRPVAIVPEKHEVTMSRFPRGGLDLDFVSAEGIDSNNRLVKYIYSLYS